jgi:predicted amidohydrolase
MKLALVSLDQAWEDKDTNLSLCKEYIKKVSSKKVDLIIFPEMTLTGFSTNIALTAEVGYSSETIKEFSKLAHTYNIAIIFGVVIRDGDKALNNSVFMNSDGEILTRYSKIHPFTFSGENKYFNAGSSLEIVNFMDMKIGLTICYDLRFPELYSSLGNTSDLIVNIANWPSKRVDHWNILLKARAIENQIFIAGVNRVGIDGNGLGYTESSNVLNANGEKVEYIEMDGMKVYNIEKDWTKKFKEKFNTTDDRRIEFYNA